jgi:Tol biopolymer transport system component
LLRRCLTKDPAQRLRHLPDVVALMQEELAKPRANGATARIRRNAALVMVGIVGALIVAVLYSRVPWQSRTKLEMVRFQIQETDEFQLTEGSVPSVSPDGKRVVLMAKGRDGVTRMWLRGMDSIEVRPLPGTETENPTPSPAYWSHDSKSIVWGATPGPYSPGQLKVLDLAGGTPRVICKVPAGVPGVAWNKDGTIVYFSIGEPGLMQVSANGGVPKQITAMQPNHRFHMLPQFLPDGRHFLYFAVSDIAPDSGMYIGEIDKAPTQQSTEQVFKTSRQAYYANERGGYLIYLVDRTLYARPFDWQRGKVSGQAVPIADDVSSFTEASVGRFALSENGVLAFNTSPSAGYGPIHVLNDSGQSVTDAGMGAWPELSPDGKHVAFSRVDPQTDDSSVWVTDLERKVSTKVSFHESLNGFPIWSPDGKYIVYGSMRSGSCRMYLARVDGSEPQRELMVSDEPKWPLHWSKNGHLLFGRLTREYQRDLWILPHPEQIDSKAVPYLQTKFDEMWARFSPDGKWVSYVSSESGSPQIYLRAFSASKLTQSADDPHWQITRTGGENPRWRMDGKEMFFVAPDMRLTSLPVDLLKPHEIGAEKKLFSLTSLYYDMNGEGSGFVTTNPLGLMRKGEAIVVKNWHAVLEKN